MGKIDWTLVDDYEFVKLAGDLLARLGFIDVDYQGDGPDGGIDLFATELVPFTIQGKQAFKWAIQCKFSVAGKQRAVGDSEIRDVEGILRSDRYVAQAPRGYMLITTRRVGQNLVERLRGIDRQSQFRTTHIDGTRLEHLLGENPEIVQRYFSPTKQELLRHMGRPELVATPSPQTLGMPVVNVQVSALGNDRTVATPALIDSGASITVIPNRIVHELQIQPVKFVRIRTLDASVRSLGSYLIELQIENMPTERVEVVAADVPQGILGRDVLSKYSVLFDGTGAIRLWKREK
jgi:predicted aspartyl protease